MKVRFFILLSVCFVLFSCDFELKKKDVKSNELIAKVYDKTLLNSDLEDVLPLGLSSQDSIVFVKNYIDSWAKKQLLLHQAELNLDTEKSTFEKLVDDYRSTLYINSYKEALVLDKLDTVVSQNDIEKYYLANNENFKLNEELIRIKYLHTDFNRVDKKGLIKLFKSNENKDIDSLQLKTLEFKSYNFNDSIWIKYTDLLNRIEFLKNESKSSILKKSKFIQKEDTLGLYLIKIKDVLKSNEIAPLSYVKPTIKQIILHKRKLELLRKIEVDLLNDAIKNQNFEKY